MLQRKGTQHMGNRDTATIGKGTVTIKDLAQLAALSPATVHLVLTGKPGPKAETRERVLSLARQMGYRCNAAASSLKRGTTRIGAVLPRQKGDNELYYAPIWFGVRDFMKEHADYNLELVEFAYDSGQSISVPAQTVKEARATEKLSGLIVLGDIEPAACTELRKCQEQQLPVVLVNSDMQGIGRISCVQAENYLLGKTIGEILLRQTSAGGSILACAGELRTPANAASIRGLEDYVQEHDAGRKIYKLYYGYSQQERDKLCRRLREHFAQLSDIACCCSVTARGSVELARALEESGRAGKLPAVGSDLFPQNVESLRRGTFQNLMFKNPYRQGWLAAEQLFRYIFHGSAEDVVLVKSEVVFQSLIPMYEDDSSGGSWEINHRLQGR